YRALRPDQLNKVEELVGAEDLSRTFDKHADRVLQIGSQLNQRLHVVVGTADDVARVIDQQFLDAASAGLLENHDQLRGGQMAACKDDVALGDKIQDLLRRVAHPTGGIERRERLGRQHPL